MSDSVRPHRQQPTRLPSPWDSPGQNTGVGCHFLLQCMKVKSESEVAQSYPTLPNIMDCSLPGSSIMGFSRQEYWSGVPLPSPLYYARSFKSVKTNFLILTVVKHFPAKQRELNNNSFICFINSLVKKNNICELY